MILPQDIDKECVALCQAMNAVPGITTIESCCGHGDQPYRIWFVTKSLRNLPRLLYYFDGCHCGHYGWRVIAKTDCGMSPVHFMLEGPRGDVAYSESEDIAKLLQDEMKGH